MVGVKRLQCIYAPNGKNPERYSIELYKQAIWLDLQNVYFKMDQQQFIPSEWKKRSTNNVLVGAFES